MQKLNNSSRVANGVKLHLEEDGGVEGREEFVLQTDEVPFARVVELRSRHRARYERIVCRGAQQRESLRHLHGESDGKRKQGRAEIRYTLRLQSRLLLSLHTKVAASQVV